MAKLEGSLGGRAASLLSGTSEKRRVTIELEPHPSILAEARRILWWTLPIIVSTVLVLVGAAAGLRGTAFLDGSGASVPQWKVLAVITACYLMIVLMVASPKNLPCEAVLILGAAGFAISGIIGKEEALSGLSDNVTTSVALLFPMAKAISDSGILESVIGKLLGTPKTVRSAVLRLYVLVGLLSAVVNNTPMIAMMLPFLELWSLRLGFDVAHLAMPMAFASQMGGSLTLMGSPTNFMAQSTFEKEGYKFGFFEMTSPASILFVLGGIYSFAMAPVLLGKKGGASEEDHARLDFEQSPALAETLFEGAFSVDALGTFAGSLVSESGFLRLPGVFSVDCVVQDGVRRQLAGILCEEEGAAADPRLGGGDLVVLRASADGLVSLRATRGITMLVEPELQLLGARRRARSVFEVELLPTSALIGAAVSTRHLRFTHHCALLAVRGRTVQRERDDEPPSPRGIPRLRSSDRLPVNFVGNSQAPLSTFEGYVLQDGDVLLVEADPAHTSSLPWLADFGVVRQLTNSAPPRSGRRQDGLRTFIAVVGAVLAIGLYVVGDEVPALSNLTLTSNLLVLVGILLISRTLKVQEVYGSMDVGVLLTIVAAGPFGQAIQNVGLASWVANSLVSLMKPLGVAGTFVAIYLVSAGLSNLISNIAVIVMMGPICSEIAKLQGFPLKKAVVLVTLASSAVYTVPIGHQTNLMVRPLGKYGFGDFFRFGFLLQCVHMLVCVALIIVLE